MLIGFDNLSDVHNVEGGKKNDGIGKKIGRRKIC